MTESLDLLTSFWMKWIILPSFLFAFIGFFFFCYSVTNKNLIRKKSKKIGIFLLGLFVFNMIVGFSLAWSVKILARQEVINLLNQPELVIKVNKEVLISEYTYRIISELKKIENISSHHSHPTEEIELEIITKNNKILTLRIRQDSEKKFKFWMFLDKYNFTKENSIGQLSTLVFIKYYGS